MKKRIEYIDAIKGFGILLVIFGHCGLHNESISPIITAGFMPWFFILSGITFKNRGIKENIQLKSKRLLIPYFFYGIILSFIPLSEWHHNILGILYSRYSLYPNIFQTTNIHFLPPFGSPLWFLTAMFISYLLFFLYIKINSTKKQNYLILLYIIIAYFCTYLPILLPWSIDTAFIGAIFIIFGYKIQPYFLSEKTNLTILLISICLIIPITIFNGNVNMSIRCYGNNNHTYSLYLFLIIGIISFIILREIFIQIKDTIATKILSIIGTQTLRLLCIHIIFIRAFNYIFKIFIKENNNLITIISIVITIFLSILIGKLIKRLQDYSIFSFTRYI